jgi:CelD/BcsL family acetyltransferase involved in cellulose biosynthesis
MTLPPQPAKVISSIPSTMVMTGDAELDAQKVNPLRDPRWDAFIEHHPQASIFHTREWLEALYRTYDYEPVVYTTAAPGERLTNGILFCKIKSWLTGHRLVSVPFSDYCQPLVESREEMTALIHALRIDRDRERWDYVELRPLSLPDPGADGTVSFEKSETFSRHWIDLKSSLEEIFAQFHKSCAQRKIRRAEREGLRYEEGYNAVMLKKFYELLVCTRRRHGLPPQPWAWFRNLAEIFGEKLAIHFALVGDRPIASILTLRHKRCLTYKYGCSDAQFHNLGGMPFLFWNAIRTAKDLKVDTFDLGRSQSTNIGLIQFKNHLGGRQSALSYYRYPLSSPTCNWKMIVMQQWCQRLPDSLLAMAGNILYRHVG